MEHSVFTATNFAASHFSDQLFETDEGKSVALAYFRNRGLSDDSIRKFGLGYAPDHSDLLISRFNNEGYSIDLLKQAGLVGHDNARDFFRARAMFPILNMSGNVAGFAGRTMSADKTVPKYINSPETAIYVKNKILYGAYQAKSAIRKFDECILVEGYMDAISLHQEGIENTVASSGTSLTDAQLQIIKQNTQNLTILYDGDAAGIKAALRGLYLALEYDLNVRIALLPDGHDPDSYVHKFGGEALRRLIKNEGHDFIPFITKVLLADKRSDPGRMAASVWNILQVIVKMPNPVKRAAAIAGLSENTGIGHDIILQEAIKMQKSKTIKKHYSQHG